MTSRRHASLYLAFSLAVVASCSSPLPVDSVSVSGEQRIPRGVTAQLTALATTAGGRIVHDVTASATWTSSDPSIASVSGGVVSGVRSGTVKITAAAGGVSGALDFTVSEANLVGIDLGPPFTLAAGVSKRLPATGSYSDHTTRDLTSSVTWTTSQPAVATVSSAAPSSGLVTSVAPGSATITATDPATRVAGSTVVTVSAAQLMSIAITPEHPSVPLGTTLQLTATGTYTDATTQNITAIVNWSSSASNVASVSSTGTGRGLISTTGVGTVTLTATEPTSKLSASTVLTVTAARLTSIAITPLTPSIALGAKQQFTATGTYTDATHRDVTGTIAWEASDPAVVQVSNTAGSNGLATSTGVGSATIKATDASSGVSATATLTVTAAQLTGIAVTPVAPSLPVGLTRQFAATGTYTDGTTHDLTAMVTWQSSSASIASISNVAGSAGLATAQAVGSTTVSATDPASGISGSTPLTVTAAQLVSISVTPASRSTPLGLATQFTAIGTYTNSTTQDLTGTVSWGSSSMSVASVSNATSTKGLATTLSTGTTTITATEPVSGVSGSTTLTVTAAQLVSIAVTPTASSVPSGLTVQFAATGTYTNGTTEDLTSIVTWSSSTPAVATLSNAVSSKGLATTASVGTTTVGTVDPATKIMGSTTLTVTAAQLVSVAVAPASPSILAGQTQQFTATGTYSDSSTADVTTAVTWSSSATNVASISNASGSNGLATAAASVPAASSATITATLAGTSPPVSGTATLTVTP
jgi:uncharacterized protein YjdB